MRNNDMRPQLRFPGFADAWVEKKLGDLGKIVTGSTPPTSNKEYYSDNGIPWVTPTDISSETISDTPRKLSDKGACVAHIVAANTILCTCIASIGKNALLTVEGSFNQQINGLTPYENNNAYFLLTESNFWSNKMKQTSAAGMIQIVNKTEFSELTTMTPSYEEQSLIGTFFSSLDRLIALNKHKLSAMKEYKKSMLQRMFPRNGSLPELRFLGFSDAWVEKKVKDLFTITRGNVLPVKMISPQRSKEMFYPVYSSQTKDSGLLGYYNEYLYENAITWTTDGANAGTVAHRDGKFYCTNVCGVLLSNDGYANQCIAEIINLIAWKHVSIAGNPKLMNNVMSEIKIVFPSLVTEQSFIGSFFSNLDRLISLQSKKLSALVLYKKALLQRMFC